MYKTRYLNYSNGEFKLLNNVARTDWITIIVIGTIFEIKPQVLISLMEGSELLLEMKLSIHDKIFKRPFYTFLLMYSSFC